MVTTKVNNMKKHVDYFKHRFHENVTQLIVLAFHSALVYANDYRKQAQLYHESHSYEEEQAAKKAEYEMSSISIALLSLLKTVSRISEDVTITECWEEENEIGYLGTTYDQHFLSALVKALADGTLIWWGRSDPDDDYPYSIIYDQNVRHYFITDYPAGDKYVLHYSLDNIPFRIYVDESDLEMPWGVITIPDYCMKDVSLMPMNLLRSFKELVDFGRNKINFSHDNPEEFSVQNDDLKNNKYHTLIESVEYTERRKHIAVARDYAQELCSIAVHNYLVQLAADSPSLFKRDYVGQYFLSDTEKADIEKDVVYDIQNNQHSLSNSMRYEFDPGYPQVDLSELITEHGVKTLADVINYYCEYNEDKFFSNMVAAEASRIHAMRSYYRERLAIHLAQGTHTPN